MSRPVEREPIPPSDHLLGAVLGQGPDPAAAQAACSGTDCGSRSVGQGTIAWPVAWVWGTPVTTTEVASGGRVETGGRSRSPGRG